MGSYNSEREDPIFDKRGSTSSESSISSKFYAFRIFGLNFRFIAHIICKKVKQ